MKGAYPFRLATTSFIFPAGYAENTRRLAPFFDEIELLLFERAADSLPSVFEVAELNLLAAEHQITYTVHWPIDIDLGSVHANERRIALDALQRSVERLQTLNLDITGYILHLPYTSPDKSIAAVNAWQERCCRGLERLLSQIPFAPYQVCLETLDYPPQWLKPFFTGFEVSLCLDIGHLLCGSFNPEEVLEAYLPRIRMFHLHGVENGKDHRSLDRLPTGVLRLLGRQLHDFKESVSLEVFSPADLRLSLKCLKACLKPDSHTPSWAPENALNLKA